MQGLALIRKILPPDQPPPPVLPDVPSAPAPADLAVDINRNTNLAWTGAGATSYQVYFGTINPPPLAGTALTPGYTLPKLAPSTTHYWSIVAQNAAGAVSGPIWRFTTRAH